MERRRGLGEYILNGLILIPFLSHLWILKYGTEQSMLNRITALHTSQVVYFCLPGFDLAS